LWVPVQKEKMDLGQNYKDSTLITEPCRTAFLGRPLSLTCLYTGCKRHRQLVMKLMPCKDIVLTNTQLFLELYELTINTKFWLVHI
jgi:hypothetical protein